MPTPREPRPPSPRTSPTRGWPASPLDAAQRAFDLLASPPAPLVFDARPIDGLPDRVVTLDELRRLLIHDATAPPGPGRGVARGRGQGPPRGPGLGAGGGRVGDAGAASPCRPPRLRMARGDR